MHAVVQEKCILVVTFYSNCVFEILVARQHCCRQLDWRGRNWLLVILRNGIYRSCFPPSRTVLVSVGHVQCHLWPVIALLFPLSYNCVNEDVFIWFRRTTPLDVNNWHSLHSPRYMAHRHSPLPYSPFWWLSPSMAKHSLLRLVSSQHLPFLLSPSRHSLLQPKLFD